jgi:hypothetical protein
MYRQWGKLILLLWEYVTEELMEAEMKVRKGLMRYGGRQGQPHVESASLSLLALDLDMTAVGLGYPTRDGQAQTNADARARCA